MICRFGRASCLFPLSVANRSRTPDWFQASNCRVISVETKQIKTIISGGVNTYPSWSPDMKKIAFRKIIGDMNSEIFVANADGSNLHNNYIQSGLLKAGPRGHPTENGLLSLPTGNRPTKSILWTR